MSLIRAFHLLLLLLQLHAARSVCALASDPWPRRCLSSLPLPSPRPSSEHAHALNWAIVDVTAEKYYADPILDRATPEILKKQLADGTYDLDSRMRRAFTEIVNKGTNAKHTDGLDHSKK